MFINMLVCSFFCNKIYNNFSIIYIYIEREREREREREHQKILNLKNLGFLKITLPCADPLQSLRQQGY